MRTTCLVRICVGIECQIQGSFLACRAGSDFQITCSTNWEAALVGPRSRWFLPVSDANRYGFTHLPLAFDDLTAASTKARPLTPSSMVGKCTARGGFLPTRAALIASATSE
jgi:hypothetical protein